MKRIILSLVWLAWSGSLLMGQHVELNYTTEMQTDFKKGVNWINLLRAGFSCQFGKRIGFEAATISISETRDEKLVQDLQTFSNIEETDLPLALAVLGLQMGWGKSSCFIGIRNLDEDYFTTPCTSLFTNSSCGIIPTLALNFPLPTYPVSAVGFDYKWTGAKWLFEASLYNGIAHDRFTGRENVFRFCPATDGILGIASVSYHSGESSYSLGSACYNGRLREDAEGMADCQQEAREKRVNWIPWGYVEQRLGNTFSWLLVHVSACPWLVAGCRLFAGAGVVVHCGKTEGGCVVDYASFSDCHEWATELTWKIPCLKSGYVQPALHIIRNPDMRGTAGLLRFGYAW